MLEDVRAALYRRQGTWPQICRDLDLSYSWVCKMAQGKIADPGVGRIERLHRYLTAAEVGR